MTSSEQPPVSPESSQEARIRELIECGEAYDLADAREALREEEDAEIYRSMDPNAVLPEIRERLASPETEYSERWDLSFRLAVIETAQTPEERKFLLFAMLLDLPTGEPPDVAIQQRNDSARRRLQSKMEEAAARIDRSRAQELFDLYRIRLQELFNEYFGA